MERKRNIELSKKNRKKFKTGKDPLGEDAIDEQQQFIEKESDLSAEQIESVYDFLQVPVETSDLPHPPSVPTLGDAESIEIEKPSYPRPANDAAFVIKAEPKMRDFKKESTKLVPAVLQRRKPPLKQPKQNVQDEYETFMKEVKDLL